MNTKIKLVQESLTKYYNVYNLSHYQFDAVKSVKTEREIMSWITNLSATLNDRRLRAFPIANGVQYPKVTYWDNTKLVTIPSFYNMAEHARVYLTRANCIPKTQNVIFDLRETVGGCTEYMELATVIIRGKMSDNGKIATMVSPRTSGAGREIAIELSEHGPIIGKTSQLDIQEVVLDEIVVQIPVMAGDALSVSHETHDPIGKASVIHKIWNKNFDKSFEN
jgi:hypothetical protein